jgi:hypothetical protein
MSGVWQGTIRGCGQLAAAGTVSTMVTRPPLDSPTDEMSQIRASLERLQATVRRLESEREAARRRRRRRLLAVGFGLSILVHVVLVLYFSTIYRWGPGEGVRPVTFEFAILHEEQLTELSDAAEDAASLDEPEVDALAEPAVPLDAGESAVDITAAAQAPAGLSAAGEGISGDTGLSGAGTSYFGISARGTRFAYIVDVSGSMSERGRMDIARRELAKSVQALPDYAYFHVVLFSDRMQEPPIQNGWVRARRSSVASFSRWLNNVSPSGGTQPFPAFQRVFALDVRPDVIYFMTDGIIPAGSADEVRALNSAGKRVVIHAIAFGDQGSREMLEAIARDSGGTYRYVADGGM